MFGRQAMRERLGRHWTRAFLYARGVHSVTNIISSETRDANLSSELCVGGLDEIRNGDCVLSDEWLLQ